MGKLKFFLLNKIQGLVDEKGQSMVEYGLLIALISVVLMATIVSLQMSIKELYPVLEPYFTPIT